MELGIISSNPAIFQQLHEPAIMVVTNLEMSEKWERCLAENISE